MANKPRSTGSVSARGRATGPVGIAPAPSPVHRAGAGRTVTEVASDDGSTVITRSVLPGGLRVVTERMSAVRSVALGVWVGVGSVDEPESLAGATHYLEHVLFKGTERRSAMDISAAFDAVGGELNAFTGKEFTCYYARVLDDDLPLAIDVLGDIVTRPLLASVDIEAERDVIAEEIAMATDDPGDAVHDLSAAATFDGHPLARPILGSNESVGGLSRRQIVGWFNRRYRLPTMVISAAGNVEHTKVVRLVRKAFAERIAAAAAAPPDVARTPSSAARRLRRTPADSATGVLRLVNRRTEQAHVVVGLPSLPRHDPRRMALSVVNTALGGGMSSRLFADIREARSLAYSVFSYSTAYADAGALALYAGCLPSKAGRVLDRMHAALADLAERGPSAVEVERAKGAMRGSLVLGLEEPSSRMSRLGKAELVYPTFKTTDELLELIDAVTVEEACAVAADVLAADPTIAVVGPFTSAKSLWAGSGRATR